MNEYAEEIRTYFLNGLSRMVCSNPAGKREPYRRVTFVRKNNGFQQECYTEKQVFHKNLTAEEAAEEAIELFGTHMRQLNLSVGEGDGAVSVEYKMSKGGKVFVTKHKDAAPVKEQLAHNRAKKYLITEGTVIPPLVDMGVFTKEGKVVNSMQDKFRQINRFLEMVDDCYDELPADRPLQIVDFGCGKSYLTFVLYYYFTEIRGREVHIFGLDLKEDVIAACNRAAKEYGYTNLTFQVGDVSQYNGEALDMVVTLHACDTATDYALYHAVTRNAKVILSVPCCQHELNRQIKSDELSVFTNYGIIKERTAALLTDAIRADLLTAHGYKTQVLEFIDMAHTPKNLLIRAVRCFRPPVVKRRALNEVKRAMEAFAVMPTLWRLLEGTDSEGDESERDNSEEDTS
ncbi:MAG: SAM-dependent methyltransferase [Lachnospiraceae bacterium]|nr:SAM-dependent methyltransferase [Lachnospiraceae bacterium]